MPPILDSNTVYFRDLHIGAKFKKLDVVLTKISDTKVHSTCSYGRYTHITTCDYDPLTPIHLNQQSKC